MNTVKYTSESVREIGIQKSLARFFEDLIQIHSLNGAVRPLDTKYTWMSRVLSQLTEVLKDAPEKRTNPTLHCIRVIFFHNIGKLELAGQLAFTIELARVLAASDHLEIEFMSKEIAKYLSPEDNQTYLLAIHSLAPQVVGSERARLVEHPDGTDVRPMTELEAWRDQQNRFFLKNEIIKSIEQEVISGLPEDLYMLGFRFTFTPPITAPGRKRYSVFSGLYEQETKAEACKGRAKMYFYGNEKYYAMWSYERDIDDNMRREFFSAVLGRDMSEEEIRAEFS